VRRLRYYEKSAFSKRGKSESSQKFVSVRFALIVAATIKLFFLKRSSSQCNMDHA